MVNSPRYYTKGQAVITVIFIAVIGMFIATGAIFSVANALESLSIEELGISAYQVAESGIEYSVLRLMRDPSFSGGVLQVGEGGSSAITITGGSQVTIQSIGTVGAVSRKIIATAHYDNLVLVIDSWKEIP